MAAYTFAQLEQLWKSAGGSAASAPVAAAVATAESSGNPGAQNYNTNGTIDRGLWQINSVHGGQSTTDIAANARAAVAISKGGTDWSPWVTYNTGAYKKYLPKSAGGGGLGQAVLGGLEGTALGPLGILGGTVLGATSNTPGNIASTAAGVVTAPLSVADALGKLIGWITNPSMWLRLGEILAGAVLVLVGLHALIGGPDVVGIATKVATHV